MPAKKKHPVRLEELTPDEKVKYEIAEELGLEMVPVVVLENVLAFIK